MNLTIIILILYMNRKTCYSRYNWKRLDVARRCPLIHSFVEKVNIIKISKSFFLALLFIAIGWLCIILPDKNLFHNKNHENRNKIKSKDNLSRLLQVLSSNPYPKIRTDFIVHEFDFRGLR